MMLQQELHIMKCHLEKANPDTESRLVVVRPGCRESGSGGEAIYSWPGKEHICRQQQEAVYLVPARPRMYLIQQTRLPQTTSGQEGPEGCPTRGRFRV